MVCMQTKKTQYKVSTLSHICSSPHTVYAEQLVPALEAAVPVRHAAGDDPADVDGRVLLLAAHHVEAKALLSFGQLNNPGGQTEIG